jgi:hypothetical protein
MPPPLKTLLWTTPTSIFKGIICRLPFSSCLESKERSLSPHFTVLYRLPLTALHTRLDLLAQQAADKGDAERKRYYYGVMFGVEIARDALVKIVTEAVQNANSLT